MRGFLVNQHQWSLFVDYEESVIMVPPKGRSKEVESESIKNSLPDGIHFVEGGI